MEEAVTFRSSKGEKLFGIIHVPDKEPPEGSRIGVNLLNPGIKYRVAPHRLNVKIARKLCEKGIYVFRFDPAGIGDSEGELPESRSLMDIWQGIQRGSFVSDTIVANDFLRKRYGISELVLAGSCGGAITALIASEKDHGIDRLCLIDIPIFLGAVNMSFADLVVEGGQRAEWYFSEYIKRAFSLQHWWRFLTFKTDYKGLWRIIGIKLGKSFSPFSRKSELPQEVENLIRAGKLNRLFFESFERFAEMKKRILFVLAGNDHGTELFQRYFQTNYLSERKSSKELVDFTEVFVVPGANHVYSLSEWQESLIGKVMSWICERN